MEDGPENMIDPLEAHLIMRKWADEQTLIVCQGTFRDAAFALTGVVSSLTDSKCQINSRKGEAKLEFIFNTPQCAFDYVERRAVMAADGNEEFAERATLMIFLRAFRLPNSGQKPQKEAFLNPCRLLSRYRSLRQGRPVFEQLHK
jgi:hypothetical protein